MNKVIVKIIPALTLMIALVVTAFYWNEARKEIVFLCGNFGKGVSEQNVLRQLETGNFLRYRSERMPSGNRIVVDSAYNFGVYKCTIDFDTTGRVTQARVE